MIRISADTAMCKGEAPDGTNVCAYRDGCLRYKATPNEYQYWSDLWKAGDDCANYLSIPKNG